MTGQFCFCVILRILRAKTCLIVSGDFRSKNTAKIPNTANTANGANGTFGRPAQDALKLSAGGGQTDSAASVRARPGAGSCPLAGARQRFFHFTPGPGAPGSRHIAISWGKPAPSRTGRRRRAGDSCVTILPCILPTLGGCQNNPPAKKSALRPQGNRGIRGPKQRDRQKKRSTGPRPGGRGGAAAGRR
jgi:hypothetical protein